MKTTKFYGKFFLMIQPIEEFLEMVLSSLSNQIPVYLFQNYTCFGAENTGRKSQVSRQLQLFLKSLSYVFIEDNDL